MNTQTVPREQLREEKRIPPKMIALCALMIAFMAACSQIQIALPVIPINLGLFGIYLTGILLGPAYGTLSVILYIVVGVAGLPVFSGMRGGIAALFGNTGGYIVGYIFTALIIGFISSKINMKFPTLIIGMIIATLACYFFGTVWYMILSGNPLWSSLAYCVFPFLPGDGIKIVLAALITPSLKKALNNL